MKLCVCCSFLISLFLFNLRLIGQENKLIQQQPYFINYSTVDGLSNNTVYQCISDSLGRLWFATGQGISRYDGNEFTNYTTLNGLEGNTVFGFHLDLKGRLWYYSFEGKIGRFENDKWHSIKGNEELGNRYSGKVISSMHVNADESILLGYKEKSLSGLVKVDSNGQVIELNMASKKMSMLYQPYEDKNVWASGDSISGKVYLPENIPIIGDIAVCKLNCLLLNSNEKKFLVLDSAVFELKNNQFQKLISLDFEMIHDVFYDSTSLSYWIATRENGVFKVKDGKVLDHYFKGQSVYYSYLDLEGGLWFCTAKNGLFYWSPDRPLYYPLNKNYYNRLINKDQEGIVLSNDTSISFWQLNQSIYKLQRTQKYYGARKPIWSEGELFIKILNKTKVYSNKLNLKRELEIPDFYCLAKKDSIIYTGSIGMNLYDLDGKLFFNSSNYKFTERVLSIFPEKNRIVLGTMNGLWVYEDSTFNRVHLSKGKIKDIIYKSGKYLILVEGKGLCIWNGRIDKGADWVEGINKSKFAIEMFDLGDRILLLFRDGHELIRFNNDSSESDYKPNSLGYFKDYLDVIYDNEQLWLLRPEGIFAIPISDSIKKQKVADLQVAIKIENEKVDLHNFPLQLNAQQNDILIQLKSISFYQLPFISYRYRVNVGSWIYLKENQIQLFGLTPGKYDVEMESLYNGNTIDVYQLELEILPPIWRRTWFVASTVCFLILLSFLIGLFYNKKKQQYLQHELLRQKAQLNALQAQINPHFLFNVFNSIQQLVLNKETKEAIRGMSKFSKLMRSVLNLSKYEFISIKDEIQFLKLYVELENLRLEKAVVIDFTIDDGIDCDKSMIPPMLLQILVENAIWHGLQERKREGKINITFKRNDDLLICNVLDNGIGIQKSKEKRSQFGRQHSSRGTSLIEEKLKILKRLYKIKGMGLIYKDINSNLESLGTIAELKIVYREEY